MFLISVTAGRKRMQYSFFLSLSIRLFRITEIYYILLLDYYHTNARVVGEINLLLKLINVSKLKYG